MSSTVTLANMNEIFNYTNVSKLIRFCYLNTTGNSAFGKYDESMQLASSDVEKFEMVVSNISIKDATENSAKQYVMHDANSDCVYSVSFFEIPASYQFSVLNGSTLVIYQKYME